MRARDWQQLELPRMARLSRPIVLRCQSLPARHIFPLHSHRWHQLVYATAGTLSVVVEDTRYVITPEQAIWVPAGVRHTTGSLGGAEFRALYIRHTPRLGLPSCCTVFSVSELLKSLIVELSMIDERQEGDTYVQRVNRLIVDQLLRLKVQTFCLPWPKSKVLQRLCEALYAAPNDPRSVEELGEDFGVSSRTLTRRLKKDMGVTLREWRNRLRLFRAVEWLGSGETVTDIALELGYASTSAFSYAFRKEMGCSPSQWRNR